MPITDFREHVIATLAIGVLPQKLYDIYKDDIYLLIWATWHYDWHIGAIMYASLNPPWGRGKFERKAVDTYLAGYKLREG